MSQASTAATTGILRVLRVQVAVTALVVHPVVRIPQLRVLWGPMQVERQRVNFAVLVNIRPTPEEQLIVIKVALLASSKLQYN